MGLCRLPRGYERESLDAPKDLRPDANPHHDRFLTSFKNQTPRPSAELLRKRSHQSGSRPPDPEAQAR